MDLNSDSDEPYENYERCAKVFDDFEKHGLRPLPLKASINKLRPDAPAVGYLVTYKGKPIEYAVYAKKECTNRSDDPLWLLHHVASNAGNPNWDAVERWRTRHLRPSLRTCKGVVTHFRQQATRLSGWGKHMMTDDEWVDLEALKGCGPSGDYGRVRGVYKGEGARGHLDALEWKRQETAGPLTALLVAYRLSARYGGERDSAALKDALREYVQAHAADFEPRTLRAIKPAKEPLIVVRRELADFQIAKYPKHVKPPPQISRMSAGPCYPIFPVGPWLGYSGRENVITCRDDEDEQHFRHYDTSARSGLGVAAML